ncbi:MAG TPA: DUF5011 domain-containing protein, partial [Thermoanaerobaculia bacterium]|nr:DUF5011 domain-containing protein [Thermoanaerobaculia bacterium]
MKSTQDGYRYRAVLNGSYFSNAFQELVSLETTSTVTCPDKVLPNELFNCTLTVTGLSDYGPRVRKPAGVVLWRDGPVLDPPDTTHCLGQPATRGCCELDLAGTCTLRFRAPATLGETRTVVTDYGTDWNPFRNYLLDQPSLGSASMVTASCAAPNITDVPEARTIATAPGECFGIMPDLRGELSVTERGCPAAVTQTPAPGTHLSAGQTLPVQFTATSGGGSVQSQSYVTIVDGSIPFITLYGDSVVNLECHQPYFEQGALASQLCSNQQPAQITQSNVDTGQPGTYFVTYGADYGPLGHPVATRVIHVTDSTAPVLSLVGPASMVSECGLYFDPGASAIDQCAGPVTPTLTILDQDGNAVATPSAGTFTYRYTASDFSGNVSSVDRTVELRDEIPPAIEPPGFPLPVLVQCRSALTLPTLLASDFCDGPVPVTTTTDADVNVPGNYTITYAARDTTGNQAQRPVPLTVTDNVKPVITLTGANPMTVECHTPFTDPGASALDACTGSLAVNASGTVDTNSVGTYTLSYSATDSSGNVQLLTRTVHVVDTTKPVIALNGANPISLECHSTYVEPGATATDACAGSFAATASASVNANVPGTYTVSYTATDGAGNAAIVVTRTVNVVDTTKPVISLNGSADVTIECHTAYVEAGATAVDACAASPTATPSGSVDSNTVGVYTVTYNATDPSGNVGTAVTRTVHVVDTTKPVIALTGANLITLECHTTFTDPGATALDACAGAVTVNATGTVNPNVPGTYTITYSATDSSGNTQSLTRTVDVVDTIRPSIVVTGANPLTLECHSSYADPGATSTDACSGALTVVTTGTVDANTPGSYTVTYSSVDGSGNTQTATRTVNVVDTTKPVVTLTGAASMNVECHTAFTDPGATATDDCDGAHPATATGVVDAQTPGTYTITYSAVDAAGNAATTVVRTVIVGDATPPVITLNGSASMTVECHTPFTDPGAVVDDTCGGQSSANVTGSVDVNAVGTYTLTYAATDANGNNATPVIRTIHVTDTIKPVITLEGSNPLTLECHTGYVEPGASATDSCAGTFAATP